MPDWSAPGFHDPRDALRVIATSERVAIGGRLGQVSRHRLAAPAVVVGVDGMLRLRFEGAGEGVHDGRVVLVRPGCWHAIDATDGRVAVFLLAPHAMRSDRLAPLRELGQRGRWLELAAALLAGRLGSFEAVDRCLAGEPLNPRPIDERLRAAMQGVARALDQNLPVSEIAAGARLSASRLMALAHLQLGTSLRAYRRWMRAFRVVREYSGGSSLTEAAFAAGFASSAHLSASARELFGVRPSDILRPTNRPAISVL